MKLKLLFLCLFSSTFFYAQTVNIPDPNFKQALLEHNPVIDTNNDSEIQVSEAQGLTVMDVHDKNIENLAGIESFVNLTELDVTDNSLTQLDVSQNINLEALDCSYNQLENLNFGTNLNLTLVHCEYNLLSSLDISNLSNLERLFCMSNQISQLDVSQNLYLLDLGCNDNPITQLDVSQNLNLESLACTFTSLQILDVSQNTNLDYLQCDENFDLISLNIANGNNQNMTVLTFSNFLLDCIQVDTGILNNIPSTWDYDSGVLFCEDCANPNCTMNTETFPESTITFYPNPVTNKLFIEPENKSNLHYTLYGFTGKQLKQGQLFPVNMQDQAAGVYFIKLTQNHQSRTYKIIKQY